jgi:glycosyltransferase involved in cell wall biosynthesis
MNVFIIPSWFPSQASEIEGIFIKEQLEEFSERYPNVNLVISTWGHADGELLLKNPIASFRALFWRIRSRKSLITKKENLATILCPTLTWSHRIPFGGWFNILPANRKNLIEAIQKYQTIDLIHAHVSYPAGYIASVLSKEFGIPYILTEHMGPFPFKSYLKKGRPIAEIEEAFIGASRISAVSSFLAREITKFGYERPVIIPNFIDERHFHSVSKQKMKEQDENFSFLTVCHLIENKGVKDLLDGISLWKSRPKNVKFQIVGDGKDAAELKHYSRMIGVDDCITWLGYISRGEIHYLYKESSAFVLTSKYESFGVVYAEALASGIPVIATRCGGPEDLINSTNGILVDVGNPEEICIALEKIYSNYFFYSSCQIRSDYLSKFSCEKSCAKLYALYKSALRRE